MLSFIALFSLFAICLGQQSTQEVSFSCGLTSTVDYATPTIIKYDKCFTNFGNGYSPATGTFVATAAGIYVFQYHTLSETQGTAWLELYKNGQYVNSAYAHNGNDYMSAGNSAILQLDAGDQVYIKSVDASFGDNTNLYGVSDEIYSTFTGYMVSPVFQDIPGHNGK